MSKVALHGGISELLNYYPTQQCAEVEILHGMSDYVSACRLISKVRCIEKVSTPE